MEHEDQWRAKFKSHRKNASRRNIPSHLTFEQYVGLAQEAGIENPSRIGKTRGQYQLGRVGDVGDYESGNCRFITVSQNQRELRENGILDEHYAAMRGSDRTKVATAALVGRTAQDHAGIAASTDARSRSFVLIDPHGNQHEDRNVREFCKEHGLCQVSISRVCRGGITHHKGWVGQYVEEEPLGTMTFD